MPRLTPHFSAIIMAAGRSSRMGREKSRLPWLDGKMLLPWIVDELTSAGWLTTVVLGPDTFAYWGAVLPGGCAVLNPDPDRGKTTSIACGAERLADDTKWILLTAVDQPRPPALYRRLQREAAAQTAAKIIVPSQGKTHGHPVVLPGSLRSGLLALDETSRGLRGLLDAYASEIHRLPEAVPAEYSWDLNTPETYESALKWFRHQTPPSDKLK